MNKAVAAYVREPQIEEYDSEKSIDPMGTSRNPKFVLACASQVIDSYEEAGAGKQVSRSAPMHTMIAKDGDIAALVIKWIWSEFLS